MSVVTRIILLLFAVLQYVVADPPVIPPEQVEDYDIGQFGHIPTTKLNSTKGVSQQLARRVWDSETCDRPNQYYFIGIHGIMVGHAGPEIIDNDGHQVWFGKGYQATYNFRMQSWRGEQYLTWWSGHDQVRGHGEGYYYMLDKNYQLFKKIGAIGEGLLGDLHEFQFTNDGTALLTIYKTIPYDLSSWGIADDNGWGYIRDCLFQEIDIETNELIFEWRASEHVLLEDCYTHPSGEGNTFDNAWDWFHINSVEKDGHGNYLVSSRYAHALFYVDGVTSETIWQVGGKNNNFTDLSGGRVTNIARQHHARWADGSSAITVFDNGEKPKDDEPASRGLKFSIDQEAMTVDVMAEAYHPLGYFSASQGSVQQLDNGNLLVGWGYAPAFTEFSSDGTEVLCDTQFAGLHTGDNGTFTPGALESYRAYQYSWVGYPLDPPDVAFVTKEKKMYVSWNGATEVREWVLEGTNELGDQREDFKMIEKFERQGFESSVAVDNKAYGLYRLTALDKNGMSLGAWAVFSSGDVQSIPLPPPTTISSSNITFWSPIAYALFGALATLLTCILWLSRPLFKWPTNLTPSKAGQDEEAGEETERIGLVADQEKDSAVERNRTSQES